MLKFSRIFVSVLLVLLISLFFISLTSVNFVLFFMGCSNIAWVIMIFFSLLVFLLASWLFFKIKNLKLENKALHRILASRENKYNYGEMEKIKLSKALECLPDGILIIDEREKIFLANSKARKILNIKSKELKDLPVKDFCRIFNLKSLQSHFLHVNPHKIKIKINNFTVEIYSEPISAGRQEIGRLVILRDMTSENIKEGQDANLMLMIIHQIKTSVASAKWSLNMIMSGDFGKITKEQKNIINKLYDKNEGLISSINNFINMIKAEEYANFSVEISADLRNLVLSEVSYFEDKIKARGIEIEFKKPKVFPVVKIDKEKIGWVIRSLIDNAIKYTAPGGKIKIFLKSDKKEIKFEIRDFGIGIPQDQQGKIFDKFFRASNANKINDDGSGLGLFMSKNIIETHGGKIWFFSEEKNGSVFCFTLPLNNVE